MPAIEETLDSMAAEIFDLYRLVAIARSRRPSGPDDLSETEFLALDLLVKEGALTIGEIQKRIGVLPAQMSRIIRALEEQGGRGYVDCNINPKDRRRIDVSITSKGKSAHAAYHSVRLRTMYETLSVLNVEDRAHFMRVLRQIRAAFGHHVSDEENKAQIQPIG